MNAKRWHGLIVLSAVLTASAWAHAAETPPVAEEAPRQAEVTTPGAADDPLQVVGEKMHQSRAMLAAANAGPLTQEVQKDIVADLDQLIAQARKAGKPRGEKDSSKSASRTPLGDVPKPGSEGKNPGETPATKASDRNTSPPGKKDDAARVLDGMKRIWGTLPPREREKVLELKAEDFVPKYRAMIEDYYRRLAAGGE